MLEDNQGIIFKVSRMYCSDEVCREDLFQDILLQLWRSFPNYNRKRKFTTWMYRVALNTAISQFRRDRREKVEFRDALPDTLTESNMSNYEKNEEFKLLRQAISRLSKAEKAITILYMDDYPYEEIAEITGISISNVGVKINRIKKKLKEYLKDAGYGL